MALIDTDIKLPAAPNVTDPQNFKELLVIYNSIRSLFDAMERKIKMPVKFFEFADIGYVMSFINVAGERQVRKALHATYEAHCVVTVAADAGKVGEVQLFGLVRIPNGEVAGTKLWLSSTFSAGITTPSPGAGAQRLGYVLDNQHVWFDPEMLP